jgi:hypothetical protein
MGPFQRPINASGLTLFVGVSPSGELLRACDSSDCRQPESHADMVTSIHSIGQKDGPRGRLGQLRVSRERSWGLVWISRLVVGTLGKLILLPL